MKAPETDLEVHGLVLNITDIGERDRMLSLYTREVGLISVYAAGAKQLKNRYMAATQPFCYGRFLLRERGGKYTLREADLKETFFSLRTSLGRAALASYVCEVVGFTGTEEPDEGLLSLTLNTLYAIANDLYPLPHIKATFEARAASLLGFMPDVEACALCGGREASYLLHISRGNLLCHTCRDSLEGRQTEEGGEVSVAYLTEGARQALSYIVHAQPERVFSYRLEEGDASLLGIASEEFLRWHIDRTFASLAFYKQT